VLTILTNGGAAVDDLEAIETDDDVFRRISTMSRS
jgi:hypothetical protein